MRSLVTGLIFSGQSGEQRMIRNCYILYNSPGSDINLCDTCKHQITKSFSVLKQFSFLFVIYYAAATRQFWWRHYVFGLSFHRVHSFVCPDRSCYHDILWTAWSISIKFTGNDHQPLLLTLLDFGGQRSKIKVTAGCRIGKGIHVDAGVSKSVFSFVCF